MSLFLYVVSQIGDSRNCFQFNTTKKNESIEKSMHTISKPFFRACLTYSKKANKLKNASKKLSEPHLFNVECPYTFSYRYTSFSYRIWIIEVIWRYWLFLRLSWECLVQKFWDVKNKDLEGDLSGVLSGDRRIPLLPIFFFLYSILKEFLTKKSFTSYVPFFISKFKRNGVE